MADTDHTVPATQFEQGPSLDLRFPPLPRTVTEVSLMLTEASDEPDIPRLADIVNADLVIAASVLRRINSAYYGLRRRIGDIRKAVFLLGYLEVCNIVLTAGMMRLREVVSNEEQTKIFDLIMRRSIGAAYFSQKIASMLDLKLKSSAFTVGLLHPIGRLILLYNKPDDYEALWYTNEETLTPSTDQEQAIFGTDHAELGALAIDRWQLPPAIGEALQHYLAPGRIQDADWRTLTLALAVGVTATEQLCLQPDSPQASFQPGAALHTLLRATDVDLTPDDVVEVIEREQQQVRSYIEAMVQL